jgi:hypothetical protein
MIYRLIGDFAALRSSAGQPSYGAIQRMSERLRDTGVPVHGVRVARLPKSTVHDLLSRGRAHPPRPDLVESLWAVLRHMAASAGRTPSGPGTLDELRGRLETINVRTATGDRDAVPEGPEALHPSDGAADGEDGARRRLLESVARNRSLAWWYPGRHLVPEWLEHYLTLERRASVIRAYAPRWVPGMLQCWDYAWHAFRHDRPEATAAELHGLVMLRMRRQEPLWRRDALRFWAVIDECVLRYRGCDPGVLRAQIEHLVSVAKTPHITVQVRPCAPDGHDATGGPVTLLRFPEPRLPDVAFVEQHDHGLYPVHSSDVSHYRQVLGRLAIEARSPDESVEFLRSLLGDERM